VAEADTHDAHTVRLDGLFRVLDELDDPRVIVKRRVPGAGDEDGVNVLERRVRVEFVDNVVSLDRHDLIQLLRRLERIGSRVEQRRKDTRISAIAIASLRLRRVGLENGEAQRSGGSHLAGVTVGNSIKKSG
jgi:hypothetical protein